jgi:hypothetical protein
MKRTLLTLTVALATSTITLNAQNVNIPDPIFKSLLVGTSIINTNSDSEIQVSEAIAFNGVISCHSQFISDLTGIEAFINITELQCHNNLLTQLDLSNNVALVALRCYNNQLTSLNIANGNNSNIYELRANSNPNLTCIQIDAADTTGYNWIGGTFQFDSGVTFSNNCGSTTGISLTESKDFINIYPNPTKGQINFAVLSNAQIASLTGQIVVDKKNVNNLDLADQPTGIYFLTLTDNNGQVIQRSKIMKE